MYQPDSRTYNRIINRLFNATMQAIHALHAVEQGDRAVQVAEQASQALQDYDEDLAEVTLRAAKEMEQPVQMTLQSSPTAGKIRT